MESGGNRLGNNFMASATSSWDNKTAFVFPSAVSAGTSRGGGTDLALCSRVLNSKFSAPCGQGPREAILTVVARHAVSPEGKALATAGIAAAAAGPGVGLAVL